jgi:hypothetical protein
MSFGLRDPEAAGAQEQWGILCMAIQTEQRLPFRGVPHGKETRWDTMTSN